MDWVYVYRYYLITTQKVTLVSQWLASDNLILVMQKTCKSEGCSRKSIPPSDRCPPCSNSFKSGEMQLHKRADNSSRQNSARSNAFAGNRDLHSRSPAHNVNPSTQGPTINATRAPPPIDVNQLYDTFDNMASGENSALKDMFGMLLNLSIKSNETEEMKIEI